MNKQKQIEEAARLEGWNDAPGLGWINPDGIEATPPDYFNDHNAIQRLVDGMKELVLENFYDYLAEIFDKDRWCKNLSVPQVLKATCAQKLEAILRAYGKFVEEGEE